VTPQHKTKRKMVHKSSERLWESRLSKSLFLSLLLSFLLLQQPVYSSEEVLGERRVIDSLPDSKQVEVWDVVIVGSGLSGLTAATRLLQADPMLKVLLVDALPWQGGRTRSINLPPPYQTSKVSIGGTFTLFEHNAILSLAQEVDCMPTETISLKDVNFGQFSKYLWNPLGLPPFLELLFEGASVVDQSSRQVMWDSPLALELSNISLEQWLNEHPLASKYFTREYFYLLENYPDLKTVSALWSAIAVWVRFRGIPHNGIEIPPKVLMWKGGTGVFTKALIDNLSKYEHFQLQLSTTVKSVRQSIKNDDLPAYPVEVEMHKKEDGQVNKLPVRSKCVIIATSPTASAESSALNGERGIHYDPPLPQGAQHLFNSMVATPTVSNNILVVYDRPWWKEVGQGVFTMPSYADHIGGKGVRGNVVDSTMEGDNQPGVLRIFCDPTRLTNMTEEEVKQSTIDFLKSIFPAHKALVEKCGAIFIHDWAEAKPTIPSVTFTFPPNVVLSKYGNHLTQPHGLIFWGGSERSFWGRSWMEGAVQRGNDVANEVIQYLNAMEATDIKQYKISSRTVQQALNQLQKAKEEMKAARNGHVIHSLV